MNDFIRPVLCPLGELKKVLLHCCCAPCSGEVMEAMLASGIDYTTFFHNPNIHPGREYRLHNDENVRSAEKHGVAFIDADYDKESKRLRRPAAGSKPRPRSVSTCSDRPQRPGKRNRSLATSRAIRLRSTSGER